MNVKLAQLKADCSKEALWKRFYTKLYTQCCRVLKETHFPEQKAFIMDSHPYRIIKAGGQVGKSRSVAFIIYCQLFFGALFEYDMNILVAGPRGEDTIHIFDYLHIFLKTAPLEVINPEMTILLDNYLSKSTNKKEIHFKDGSRVCSATTDNPEMIDIRGENYDLVIGEEFQAMPHQSLFLDAALVRLADVNRTNLLLIIGTPQTSGPEFSRLYNIGQTDNPKVKSYWLSTDMNPYRSKDATEAIHAILGADSIARELGGHDVPLHGRMFSEFNFETQVQPQTFNPSWILLGGVDFGNRKPVVVFAQYDGYNLRCMSMLAPHNIIIDNLILDIKGALSMYPTPLTVIGTDPAGDKVNDVVSYNAFGQLKKAFPVAQYVRSHELTSKANQISLFKTLFKQNRVFIDPQCQYLIASIMQATYDTDTRGSIITPGWKKIKGIDDPLDALAYMCINFSPIASMIVSHEKTPLTPIEDSCAKQLLQEFEQSM